MTKVIYSQAGYVGSSMSKRAVKAYSHGEMPKSRWTKKAILEGIADELDNLDELNDKNMEKVEAYPLWFLKDWFLWHSSSHHTSKFANLTNFYSIDESAVKDFAEDWEEADRRYRYLCAKAKIRKELKKRGMVRPEHLISDAAWGTIREELLYKPYSDSLLRSLVTFKESGETVWKCYGFYYD